MISAWFLIPAFIAGLVIGLLFGLNARKQMNHAHQFQDHYLPGDDNE